MWKYCLNNVVVIWPDICFGLFNNLVMSTLYIYTVTLSFAVSLKLWSPKSKLRTIANCVSPTWSFLELRTLSSKIFPSSALDWVDMCVWAYLALSLCVLCLHDHSGLLSLLFLTLHMRSLSLSDCIPVCVSTFQRNCAVGLCILVLCYHITISSNINHCNDFVCLCLQQ